MGKIIVANDIPDAVRARVLVEEVLGLARPAYNMRKMTRVINSDVLNVEVPIATTLTGQEKVPALVQAELAAQSYTNVAMELYKNVVHIAVALETELKAPFDVMRMNVADAAKEVARMENKQIDAILTANLTGVTGTDWGVQTNFPLGDIAAGSAPILDNGYEPDIMAISPETYGDMITNSSITTILERGWARETRLPTIAGLKIIVEPQMLDTEAYIVDSKAPVALVADGPNKVVKYTGNAAFFDAYVIAKFLDVKFVTTVGAAAGRKLTGV